MTDTQRVVMLEVADLVLGDDFRLDDDPQQITELATSIRNHGLLQPLLVRQRGEVWEVVAGRRRLAAARELGADMVPCAIHSLDDDAAAEIALTENLHRRDLSPVEKGLGFARMRDSGLSQREIAERVGYSQATISKLLLVLDLPAALRDKVHRGKMSYATALDARRGGIGKRWGGPGSGTKVDGPDAQVASHWRRRHDRLLAGIYAVLKERPVTNQGWIALLDRLLKLDKEPLPEAEADEGNRRPRSRFKEAVSA